MSAKHRMARILLAPAAVMLLAAGCRPAEPAPPRVAFWKRDAVLVVQPQGLALSGVGSHIDPYPMLLYHRRAR